MQTLSAAQHSEKKKQEKKIYFNLKHSNLFLLMRINLNQPFVCCIGPDLLVVIPDLREKNYGIINELI